MTGVVTDECIKCKQMDCVEVCPVDAFYEGENMLVINPRECVDCGCCIAECPIDAIAFETEPKAVPWIELNAKYSELWPNVTFKGDQTPVDAEKFHGLPEKYDRYFSSSPGAGDVGKPAWVNRPRNCDKCNEEGIIARAINAIRKLLS